MTSVHSRHRATPWVAAAGAVAALLFATSVQAQWAWKEDNGRVVYSDRPPPANIKSEQITRQPSGVSLAPRPVIAGEDPVKSGDAKSEDKPSNAPKTIAERELEFRKRMQEREAAERKAQQEQQKTAARAAECERARGYLRSLEEGIRIARTDAAGNREVLDDDQRAAEMERTRKSVQQICN
jgi:hypothetical protein